MNRQKVLEKVRQVLLEIDIEDLKKDLSKDFYNMDSVIEALYYGISANKNIILYGPGGFGKSQIVKAFLSAVNIRYSTIVGNEATEVDALLGIPNIKKLTEQSVYEIAFDRTVFRNPGVLVLEEFLDVRPSTASALKDILSEGGLRQGNTFIESLISSVIICSNKTPEEVSIDDSTAAFYKERFPIRVNVLWNFFSKNEYLNYLKIIKKDSFKSMETYYEVLAEIAEKTSINEVVSPRVVKDASDLLDVHKDIRVLTIVDGLSCDDVYDIAEYIDYIKEKEKVDKLVKSIQDWYHERRNISISAKAKLRLASELNYMVTKLHSLNVVHSDNSSILTHTIVKYNDEITNIKMNLQGDIGESERISIDELFK
jgi:MoxR-like ATPase